MYSNGRNAGGIFSYGRLEPPAFLPLFYFIFVTRHPKNEDPGSLVAFHLSVIF